MISISSLNTTSVLTVAGPLIVGLTFVSSGVIKAIAPHVFQNHLSKLGWIPWKLIPAAVVAAAAVETGWGLALMVRTAPSVMIPVTIVALVVLTGITWWSVRSGKTTDCGCYGGYVVPSMGESIGINGGLILLLLVTPRVGTVFGADTWKIIAALVAAIASGIVAALGITTLRKTGHFLIDTSPLKIGRQWRNRWGAEVSEQGEHLVSFLGPECPHCKQWVRVLNAVSPMSDLPSVAGVVATTDEKLGEFVATSGIRFPMHVIPQSLMNRLVYGVPTTALISNGRISNLWTGNISPEFYNRFRDAFFPGGSSARQEASVTPPFDPARA